MYLKLAFNNDFIYLLLVTKFPHFKCTKQLFYSVHRDV